jgi:hypothetical protein
MPGARPSHEFFILRYCLQSFKVGAEAPNQAWDDVRHLILDSFPNPGFGANMGEVIRFIPKSERERARLIREARAIYDSIFPPADPASGRQDMAPVSHLVGGANAHRSDGLLLS